MIDLSDIVFCIGSSEAKRLDFRKNMNRSTVYVDNDEVYACITENGRTFFVIGAFPFADMSVSEFIRYNRMIITRDLWKNGHMRKFIKKSCGKRIGLRAKVGSLGLFAYRAVQILSLITTETEEILVNFDGLPYSKENRRSLYRFLSHLKQRCKVVVAVSDNRFIYPGSTVRRYETDGGYGELSLKADSRVLRGRRLVNAYISRRGLALKAKDIKKIIVSI